MPDVSRAAISLLVLAGGLLLLLVLVPRVVLLAFAAMLLAVALRGAADPITVRSGLPERPVVGLVLIATAALIVLTFALAAPAFAEQVEMLFESIPEAAEQVAGRLEEHRWGRAVLEELRSGRLLGGSGAAADGALVAATGTASAITETILAFVIGVFLALTPGVYVGGLTRLVAPSIRPGFRAVLDATGTALRGWLVGQGISMTAVGIMITLGLWALGVGPAVALGAIAGLLAFVPVIGAIAGAVPALLMAAGEDLSLVLWVLGLFIVVQVIEGDVVTPLAQRRTARVHPAILLLFQLAMFRLFGLLGLFVAAPLAAASIAAVREAYVERWVEAESGSISPRA